MTLSEPTKENLIRLAISLKSPFPSSNPQSDRKDSESQENLLLN